MSFALKRPGRFPSFVTIVMVNKMKGKASYYSEVPFIVVLSVQLSSAGVGSNLPVLLKFKGLLVKMSIQILLYHYCNNMEGC